MRLFSLLFLLICTHAVHAQPGNYRYKTYTTLDGLTDNGVVKTLQDRKGFLWVATRSGLSRFDGTTFTNYNHIPGDSTSLRSNWITDLALDPTGVLWISTEWGLCWYDEMYDCFRYINPRKQMLVLYKGPLCMDGSTLWMASEDGLQKVNTVTKTFVTTVLQRIPTPQCVVTDAAGRIWVGTRGNGFFVYEPAQNKCYPLRPGKLPANAHIMDLHREGNTIWAATSDGMLRINAAADITIGDVPATNISGNSLMCTTPFLPITGDSLLLCGTYDKRLLLFNKNTRQFTSYWRKSKATLNDMPEAIFFDLNSSNGILWIGTDHGLCKLNMYQQDYMAYMLPQFSDIKNKIFVRKVMGDDRQEENLRMLAGKPDSGLFVYNARNAVLERFSTIGYTDMETGADGKLWCARAGGLDVYSKNNQLLQRFFMPVNLLCVTQPAADGRIWAGTETGVAVFNIKQKKYTIYNYTFNGTAVENKSFDEVFPVADLQQGRDGTIWLASLKYGLFSFDTVTHQFTPHRQPFDAAYETRNRCAAVAIDGQQNVWSGNMGGLTRYNPASRSFTNFDSMMAASNTYVYSIRFDDRGILWGRGNRGVFAFDPATQKLANYQVPLQMDALYFKQKITLAGNRPAAGFEGGYIVFNPAFSGSVPAPLVYITSCSVMGNRLPFAFNDTQKNRPVFKYNENVIGFTFTAVNHELPGSTSYTCMLEGLDKDWQPVSNGNSRFYSSLGPGNYTFRVKARSSSGVWTTADGFSFKIQPPFWRTWWFRVFSVLLLTSLIYFIFRRRVRAIKKEEQQKTAVSRAMAELEMKTLRSQMNPHFIFNSLNSIQKFIWENKKDDASDYLSKFARLVRLILEHSSESQVSLAQELSALKTYIELEHRRSNARFEYSIFTGEGIDINATMLPPLLLQPFVENAIWHGLNPLAERNGWLHIKIFKNGNNIECVIEDNGIGRKESAAMQARSSLRRNSVGMNITEQRVDLLNVAGEKKVSVQVTDKMENGSSTGTLVTIILPLVTAGNPKPE